MTSKKIKKKISLRYLLILVSVILIIVINAVTIGLYSMSYENLAYDNIVQTQVASIRSLLDLVDTKLQNQMNITMSMSKNKRIREIILDKPTNLLTQINNDSDIKEIFLDYTGSLDYIYSINIFTKNYLEPQNTMMVGDYANEAVPFAINDYRVFENYILDDQLYSYKDRVFFNLFYNYGLIKPMLMTLNWIEDSEGEQIGVLTLLVPFNHTFSSLNDFEQSHLSDFHIMDGDGQLVYTTSTEVFEKLISDQKFTADITSTAKDGGIYSLEYDERIITFSQFEDIKWVMFETTPKSVLYETYEKEKNRIIIISVVVSLAMMLLVILFSTFMLKGLRDLLNNIKQVKDGKLEIATIPSAISEVDELNTDFVRMTNRISTLMADITEANKKEREAELMALQAQINPHFLYNTLDALYWMSDDENMSDIINTLGKFFRLSLSKGMEMVPAESELSQVRSYVKIQSMIYCDRFTFEEFIDADVYNYKMLKLILQPMVENAILHGFENKKTGGHIELRIDVEEDIIIQIKDNGEGIDLIKVNRILTGYDKMSGYGMRNVNERIRLKFGEQYGIKYSISNDGGAIVTMKMPKIPIIP